MNLTWSSNIENKHVFYFIVHYIHSFWCLFSTLRTISIGFLKSIFLRWLKIKNFYLCMRRSSSVAIFLSKPSYLLSCKFFKMMSNWRYCFYISFKSRINKISLDTLCFIDNTVYIRILSVEYNEGFKDDKEQEEHKE